MQLDWTPFLKAIVASIVYSILGIALFGLCFLLLNALSPFSIRKEIEHDHNTALAVLMGSFVIGLSIIIAAAISG